MDVDSRTFELLEAIATDGTLTAAARRLHLSQPALSQRLTGLESRLGVALFTREGRRLVPTRAGRRMITASGVVLGELRAAERDLADLRHGRDAVIRLASQCTTNYRWLPPVVQSYAEAWPGVELRIEPAADDDVIGALLADKVDLAIAVKADRRLDGVATRPLFTDEFVAVVPTDHPWAGRPHLSDGDLDEAHLIVFDVYDPGRTPTMPLPIPAGVRPARVTTTPVVSELVIELVVAGQGIGVLPSWVAAPSAASGRVATVRMQREAQPRQWFCAWPDGEVPAHLDAFVDHLVSHLGAAGGVPIPVA